MIIHCGSCNTPYQDSIRECSNCGFPNFKFEPPVRSPIEIVIEVGIAKAMVEKSKQMEVSVDVVWEMAADDFISKDVREYLKKQKSRAKVS